VACAMAAAPSASVAQSTNPPSQSEKKHSAEKFPFPGESSAPAQGSTPPPSSAPQPANPVSAPAAPAVSPDKKFPFPGESGSAPSSSSSRDASSSSSSSDGDSNPADAAGSPDAGGTPELKDKGSEGQQTLPGRHILHRVNPQGTKLQSPEERAAEDVNVARFYIDSGNFDAAYLRGADAVKLQPDDPSAHFVLAEAAMKLNKRDQAIDQYQQCLKLDPLDKEAKAARKALERLQAQR
jgi:hypothetical protein